MGIPMRTQEFFCLFLIIPQTSYQSQGGRSGDQLHFREKKLHETLEKKWHRRLGFYGGCGHERNRDSGDLDEKCNVCALANIIRKLVTRAEETQAKEKLENVLTEVMGPLKESHFKGSRSAICLQTSTQKLCLWTCLRKRKKHWPA